MSFYNKFGGGGGGGGGGRRGYDDDRWHGGGGGGGNRYNDGPGPRGRFGGGSGKGRRDKQEGRRDDRGSQGSRGDGNGNRKRKYEYEEYDGDSANQLQLKGGNNWHGIDRHPLMQAVPMESKPENFEEEWMFTVCPQGRRRTLVAANNITQSYNNAQDPDLKFESCLPSGNCTKDAMFKQQDLTILDTLYNTQKKTFYVLDMVHWKHYPYYETEADFRFFCLDDKWAQLKDPIETSSLNHVALVLLSKKPCANETIEEALKAFDDEVEELLFIRKSSLYEPEASGDYLKLKLDKLKDVLGIDVPEGVVAASKDDQKKDAKRQKEEKKEEEDINSKDENTENQETEEKNEESTETKKDDENDGHDNENGDDDGDEKMKE